MSRPLRKLFERGFALYQQGQLAQAEKVYKRILETDPYHFDALHLLGIIALQTDRREQGIELIERAIRSSPQIAEAHNNLGMGLQMLKRHMRALSSYDKAIALRPDYAEAYNNRGIVLSGLNRREEALASYDKAIALRPDYAEAYSNRGNALRQMNRNEEALASYGKAIALRPDYAEAYSNRGNALRQMNRNEEALASYDKAIALRPHYADAYNNRGIALLDLNRREDALASHDEAIALKPDDAEAYSNRGNAMWQMSRHEEALASYDKAIALRPHYVEAYNNRGVVLSGLNRCKEALTSYDKAFALRPDYAEAHSNRGKALWQMNRHEEALASYDKAIALRPDYAEAHFARGLALLTLGRFEQGWQLYEWRKKIYRPAYSRLFPQPLWLGKENISGKILFLHWEQGFGDTIQIVRYVKLVLLMGAKAVVSVQDPLLRLLRQMDSDIEFIGGYITPERFDYHCPLMSLPLAFGTTLETIPSELPYLRADAKLRAHWETRLSKLSGRRVGLVWAGGLHPDHPEFAVIDKRRSISLAAYRPLADVRNVSFISLQTGPSSAEARPPPEGLTLHDWTDELVDFADTAALIEGLDLVVSVDTAVAHLAGALGKPVWLINRFDTCWRWLLERTDSPWYANLRLFRQSEMGNWSTVIEEVKRELQKLQNAHTTESQVTEITQLLFRSASMAG